MKHLFYCLAFVLAMMMSPFVTQAQSRQVGSITEMAKNIDKKNVVGAVVDENGEPLIGASVVIEGTNRGTVTDVDGNFSILVSGKNPVLVFSYLGMESKSMAIPDDAKLLRVTLSLQENMMNEVVVTGYQNFKRENATGAYHVLGARDMDKRYTGDITSNLEGKIPGMVVDRNQTGEAAITIRGISTFSNNLNVRKPLVVVDGLPIEGGIESVNPYDIENITVLKDAAAVSIYGARASNGVIVITSKSARDERLSIEFNADVTISERQCYDNYNWASAADLLALEQYNFDAMLEAAPGQIDMLVNEMWRGRFASMSQAQRMLVRNYMGEVSDEELRATFDRWSRNDYRKEYRDIHDRNLITHQYNLALRNRGRVLNSSFVVNYAGSNRGVYQEHNHSLSFKYSGDLKVAKWFDLGFGVNVLNSRSKHHAFSTYTDLNSFSAYQSMYNDDGTLARMEADIYPGETPFNEAIYELKDPTFNMVEEMNYNFTNSRQTNIRSYVHALLRLPVEGWTVSGQFQYEDIMSRTKTRYNRESQYMRSLYNRYTTAKTETVWVDDPNFDWNDPSIWDNPDLWNDPHFGQMQVQKVYTNHAIPYGDLLSMSNTNSRYYTFRAQTQYNREFGCHAIDVLAGFEFRQTHTTNDANLLYGYDHSTQTNLNLMTDWAFLNQPSGVGVLGDQYSASGAPKDFTTSDILHRFYSYYFTGNYSYNKRYAVSASYRVDRTDLFGADPKFRGRPLWSVGASWNIHNETFMESSRGWLDALKLRVSYGLTGNIDSSISSYLVAKLSTNPLNGGLTGSLLTPPNDQLRWEKTATWNAGVDFAFFGYRLNGSIDFYKRSGSDLLTETDLDPTTGWEKLTINNGNMTNTGIELMLNGHILKAGSRRGVDIKLGFNMAYNKNKVTSVPHKAQSGSEYLSMALHEGYPIHSLFSIDYAGLIETEEGHYRLGWRDRNGEVHTESYNGGVFTVEDAIFSGTYTPTISGAIVPEISWRGITLSAMFSFYGGHYMRTDNAAWNNTAGQSGGYGNTFGQGAYSRDLLRYWEGDTDVPANGYLGGTRYNVSGYNYRHTNIERADYVKLRNLVIGYEFPKRLCRAIGMQHLRVRFQANNLCTWARNSKGLDPEAVSPVNGSHLNLTPRSYTMSISFNF